jgi:hypothetical protein
MRNIINRRRFLGGAIATAVGTALVRRGRGESLENEASKLILSAPLTHSDWMLKNGIQWGEPGVKHMLDACKACGWSRIYWRALDGGRSNYKSKLLKPGGKWDEDNFWNPQNEADRKVSETYSAGVTPERKKEIQAKCEAMDYGSFDSLAAAVKYGHSIGLQIHAWVSINEDDHGWGIVSEFARTHPQYCWVRRDGRAYHSQMSFAFEEVRKYKLAILQELMGYDIDGIFMDWIRTGDVRDNPQTDKDGVADNGYETLNVEAFKSQFCVGPHDVANNDPRGVKVRAEPQTVFMREARKVVGAKPLAVMVGHPWHYRGHLDPIAGNLKGLLLDVSTWAKEGLVDSAVAAGYYRAGGNAEKACNALKEETGGKADVWLFGWVPNTVADLERDLGIAERVGAKQVLFWEADYIDDRANAAELKAAMSSRART